MGRKDLVGELAELVEGADPELARKLAGQLRAKAAGVTAPPCPRPWRRVIPLGFGLVVGRIVHGRENHLLPAAR